MKLFKFIIKIYLLDVIQLYTYFYRQLNLRFFLEERKIINRKLIGNNMIGKIWMG